jgi:hypothetical protein
MWLSSSFDGLPPGPPNSGLPVFRSTTDWWMCIEEPGSSAWGLAMKVA